MNSLRNSLRNMKTVFIETRNKNTFVVWHTGRPIKCYGSLSQAQAYVDSL